MAATRVAAKLCPRKKAIKLSFSIWKFCGQIEIWWLTGLFLGSKQTNSPSLLSKSQSYRAGPCPRTSNEIGG
ncbi:hypothetical protein FCV25MIE_24619 [Fagus crenata]